MSWFHKKLNSLSGRIMPVVPGRWQLGFIYRVLKLGGDVENEVSRLDKIGPCRGLAIDVGANYGLYSLPLSRLYAEVVAFEPNQQVSQPLVNARIRNVRIIHEGLSSSSGEATLHIPVANGVVLAGWASFDADNCAEATSLQSRTIAIHALDHHGFANVGFIKIDVEGHEVHVLRGGETTIRRDRPYLLIEVRDKHRVEVRSLLAKWGYAETTLQELAGVNGSPENMIFLPK